VRVEYRVLGPLEVRADGELIKLGGPRQRALLAMLLLSANRVVSRDRFVDELLGAASTDSVDRVLRVQISRLRKSLGDDRGGGSRIVSRAPGYLLRVESGELDLERFESLLSQSRAASEAHDHARTAELLAEAESLWRGRPLADLEFEPFARIEVDRLEELRLVAAEERIDSELALGRHSRLVAELEAQVAAHPLREHLRGQLMTALYRCGRQADALEAYRTGRAVMSEELGLEPGPALKQLERSILLQDPGLEIAQDAAEPRPVATAAPPAYRPPPDPADGLAPAPVGNGRRRLRASLAALTLVVLGIAVAIAAVATSGGARALRAAPNSTGVIDSRADTLSGVIDTAGRPGAIAAGAGAVWETDTADGLLLELGPGRRVVERIPVGRDPTGVAVGGGEVWVVSQLQRTVSEINPRSFRSVASFGVGNGAAAVAYGDGSLWVANVTDDTVSRVVPATGSVATIPLSGRPGGIAVGPEGVWVTSPSNGQLLMIDPRNDQVTQAIEIGNGPVGVDVGNGYVWVANTDDGSLSRFDPDTGAVTKIPIGTAPVGVAFGDGAVWVTLAGSVARVDPRSRVVRQIRVGAEPTALTIAGKDVWMTVLPPPASHRGGTLRIVEGPPYVSASADGVDPAGFSGFSQWQMLSMTNDGLVTYRRTAGLAGGTLVPDLATSLPTPTDGGRTYTFRLRTGIRYSDGSLVRPEDFRRAIERVFMVGSAYPQSFYSGLVGARRCAAAPGRCSLPQGITTDDISNTVTFHLTAPDPEFLYKLAFPMADAVPADTPGHDLGRSPPPATGPYMTQSVSSLDAGYNGHRLAFGTWTLVRNPRFRQWSSDAQPAGSPDRIVLTQQLNTKPAVAGLQNGRVDALVPAPTNAVERLAVRYPNQLHDAAVPAVYALVMNTRVAPFNSPSVRRALNYAIDRNRIVELAGGARRAQPTCQILPPTLAGYQPYCPYTLHPSAGGRWSAAAPEIARRLVSRSGTRGARVTVLVEQPGNKPSSAAIGRYVASVLNRLGFRASTRAVPNVYGSMGDSRNRSQIGWFGWLQDYPAASNSIDALLTCHAFIPGSPLSLNGAEFCAPGVDAQIKRATALEAVAPGLAGEQWSRIDREITNRAPWLPLYNPRVPIAVSAQVGNYQDHPNWILLFDQLWVH
jgi:ABC-type transport system substrate-binding protein/DNA-binding SARP family transcriptional activator/streptogramin lyase